MSKISILHISDIHFERNEPENQGLIINSFFDDLEKTLPINNYESNHCFISGDLVNKGGREQVFNDFYDNFIHILVKFMPITHIYTVPGNHDFDRRLIESNFEDHQALLSAEYS